MLTQHDVHVLDEAATAAAVLNPIRLKVLAELGEPGSATTVAKTLGLARQKVNYHVRELEKRGLLEEVATRRRRNCIERILQSRARTYVVDPAALGPLQAEPANIKDRFSTAYLLATAARTIRDVAALRREADRAGKKLATFTLESAVRFRSPRDQAAFLDELTAAVGELVEKYHSAGTGSGRSYRVTFTGHPMNPDPSGD